jgi:hypothetical protein
MPRGSWCSSARPALGWSHASSVPIVDDIPVMLIDEARTLE